MPRFMVERTFKDGLTIPVNDEGSKSCVSIVEKNGDFGVTWVHSYVSVDHNRTYCVYDGPDESAIRKAAQRNGLPVDRISEVSVLDPYFYH